MELRLFLLDVTEQQISAFLTQQFVKSVSCSKAVSLWGQQRVKGDLTESLQGGVSPVSCLTSSQRLSAALSPTVSEGIATCSGVISGATAARGTSTGSPVSSSRSRMLSCSGPSVVSFGLDAVTHT
ncbi:hypothetical protein GOODEAATRI_013877 [Goodea atripinnis]|uniref:Uncharacterized protein n=1 Tax=Goodea atripinnis TaxID=208336 RepID=A0ABV0PDY5_9TELE